MNRCYLIAVAAASVLGAGCEQLKSPERIRDLESRVDDLSAEVSALTGKPVGGKPKDDKEDKDEKKGEKGKKTKAEKAKGKDGKDGKESKAKDSEGHASAVEGEPEDEGKPKGKGKAKDSEGDEGKAETKEAKGDSKGETADGEDDPAVARLKALVAKSGGKADKPSPHWGYEAKDGPSVWGSLDPGWIACEKGSSQSPIDIEPKSGKPTPIAFHYVPTAASVLDNGHTLQVNLAPGSTIEIDEKPYELVQFHFHTPSEHSIAGEHYPLEVHLVHKNAAGKLAVIGVMYDAGADSKALAQVFPKWPKKVNVEDKLRKPFDPSTLLPETRTVYRYQGSLTTPPCTEGVLWNVMRRTMTDSKADLDAFSRHYPHNAREVQALNDRKIE